MSSQNPRNSSRDSVAIISMSAPAQKVPSDPIRTDALIRSSSSSSSKAVVSNLSMSQVKALRRTPLFSRSQAMPSATSISNGCLSNGSLPPARWSESLTPSDRQALINRLNRLVGCCKHSTEVKVKTPQCCVMRAFVVVDYTLLHDRASKSTVSRVSGGCLDAAVGRDSCYHQCIDRY